MRVAAAQLGPASATQEETVARVIDLIASAAAQNVKLICFPELALTPYFAARCGEPVDAVSLREPDPHIDAVRAASAAAGVWVVLPVAERDGRVLYNSAVAINPAGEVVARYRKVHIPSGFARADGTLSGYERSYFRGGSEYTVWRVEGFGVGALICFDRFYPEAGRILAQMGADILCYPANNRAYGSDWAQTAWEIVVRTRAYENGCLVIAPSKAGVERGERFLGDSLVASPIGGQVLARATTDGDELVSAEFDQAQLEMARSRFDFARDRRPDTYGAITA